MTSRRRVKPARGRRGRRRPHRKSLLRRVSAWLPRKSTRRRWRKRLRVLPRSVQILLGVLALACASISLNWIYHVARKPSELFFPVSGRLDKSPGETWRAYEPLFRSHSTPVVSAELLAALAQIEGAGNPVARTYWRWSLSANPLSIYRPASSAVGMYQLTDGTFSEARRYCIHDHVVVEDGPWHDIRSCWLNGLYTRVVPSHAVELTAAHLDRRVGAILARRRISSASLERKQDLAAVIHLCGASAGAAFATRGFRFEQGMRCGDHDPDAYLSKVRKMKALFAGLAHDATR